jgi:hypothetical protein
MKDRIELKHDRMIFIFLLTIILFCYPVHANEDDSSQDPVFTEIEERVQELFIKNKISKLSLLFSGIYGIILF